MAAHCRRRRHIVGHRRIQLDGDAALVWHPPLVWCRMVHLSPSFRYRDQSVPCRSSCLGPRQADHYTLAISRCSCSDAHSAYWWMGALLPRSFRLTSRRARNCKWSRGPTTTSGRRGGRHVELLDDAANDWADPARRNPPASDRPAGVFPCGDVHPDAAAIPCPATRIGFGHVDHPTETSQSIAAAGDAPFSTSGDRFRVDGNSELRPRGSTTIHCVEDLRSA